MIRLFYLMADNCIWIIALHHFILHIYRISTRRRIIDSSLFIKSKKRSLFKIEFFNFYCVELNESQAKNNILKNTETLTKSTFAVLLFLRSVYRLRLLDCSEWKLCSIPSPGGKYRKHGEHFHSYLLSFVVLGRRCPSQKYGNIFGDLRCRRRCSIVILNRLHETRRKKKDKLWIPHSVYATDAIVYTHSVIYHTRHADQTAGEVRIVRFTFIHCDSSWWIHIARQQRKYIIFSAVTCKTDVTQIWWQRTAVREFGGFFILIRISEGIGRFTRSRKVFTSLVWSIFDLIKKIESPSWMNVRQTNHKNACFTSISAARALTSSSVCVSLMRWRYAMNLIEWQVEHNCW